MAFRDIIRYEGGNDVIVFRHPTVDFNKKTQLDVRDKQEAIVYMNGSAKGLYTTGTYILESDNIAGVKHLVALFSGGELANHCEVYFINKLLFDSIPWVATQMDIQDKTMGNYYSFWPQGYFSVRVENSYKLFEIIGHEECFTTDSLKEYFKERITSITREVLSIAMNQEGLSYGEINSHLTSLSEKVLVRIKPAFEKIGLILDEFRFDSVNMEKDAEYDKHRGHLGERTGQKIEGYTYDKKRMYDTLEKQAENQSGSGAAGAMMTGAGYGIGMGQVYSGMVGGAAKAAFNSSQGNVGCSGVDSHVGIVHPHKIDEVLSHNSLKCKRCGKELQPGWNCCPYCGEVTGDEKRYPHCGEAIPNGMDIRFCPSCQNKLF